MRLLASLLLRFEGAKQIRAPMIESRVSSIEFLSRLLNLPMVPFELVRLSEFLTEAAWESRRPEIRATNLTMLREGADTVLAVWLLGVEGRPHGSGGGSVHFGV